MNAIASQEKPVATENLSQEELARVIARSGQFTQRLVQKGASLDGMQKSIDDPNLLETIAALMQGEITPEIVSAEPKDPEQQTQVSRFLTACALQNQHELIFNDQANPFSLPGTDKWNDWKAKQGLGYRAPLYHISLVGLPLTGFYLDHANLTHAYLGRCDLDETNFSKATMNDAMLEQTSIRGSNFCEAMLIGVNFSQATIGLSSYTNRTTYFEGAHLHRARFHQSTIRGDSGTCISFKNVKFGLSNESPFEGAKLSYVVFHGSTFSNQTPFGKSILENVAIAEVCGGFD